MRLTPVARNLTDQVSSTRSSESRGLAGLNYATAMLRRRCAVRECRYADFEAMVRHVDHHG
jgi:microsomal dipeptidase-like Zn-dependent dipeptidase